ncbi:NAD(P)H-binding protein [Phytoactinopolyspora alkaliphila]|uniref:NAD(P)H-binding protein n=1 Tax=Phytoactinopolyspora alkaliphila TaxID=1783498 RepID=A0A6N9YP66_9ACTN|nr:NAD(P)H-binding protein [Phytoactinopolyspora alkaliphila]NED96619.1 NAD(P)H-binding protein [Phytoactinopolyspora alkaliphila]
MTQKPILVLGGTGKTGRRVAAQLAHQGHQIRAASRRSRHRFDWADQSTWKPVLDGAHGVYIMQDDADDGSLLHGFVELAVTTGVQRVVLLSAREWADMNEEAAMARERIVQESGLEWTILRPVWFAQNFSEEPFLSVDVAAGEVTLPTDDGRHPFVDAEDIAAVAVAALTEKGHAGQIYELSGPRAITVGEAVEEIAAAADRPIRHVRVSSEQYADHLVRRGLYPREVASGVAALAEFIRRGDDARLSDGVRRALGREPRDFTEYVKTTAEAGGWHA